MIKPSSRILVALAAVGGLLLSPRRVDAQADVNLPLPNVLLLVDSSGSMEYVSSGNELPECNPATTGGARSRWIELVEVLTGSIQDYRCQAVNRASHAFSQEFGLGGEPPYDYGYPKPYHRPLSGTCTPGPGTARTDNPYLYPDDAIRFHPYTDLTTSCSTFLQSGNGLLDTFLYQIRFGLMTFDTLAHPGTGIVGSEPGSANYSDGIEGTWSYYVGSPRQGWPAGCRFPADQEVGARNAAAPPWEGRMIAFGPANSGGQDLVTRNGWIQKTLLATRPYGATPIAGMLDDARAFLRADTKTDPLNAGEDFGPYRDAFMAGGCRSTHVLLLSDGEPNMDLRPSCALDGNPDGHCPYDKPEDIAHDLAYTGDVNRRVPVHVVGFALPTVTLENSQEVDCTELTDDDLTDADGLCETHPNERELQACCTLNRIAFNGGTGRAHFANDASELRQAIAEILRASASATSRTVPAFSSGAAGSGANGFRFFSSFRPTRQGLWTGVLERQRFVCNSQSLQAEPEPIDPQKGDDFAANLNSGTGPARRMITFIGGEIGGLIHSARSIRPFLADNDGVGLYTGTPTDGAPDFVAGQIPPAAARLPDADCASDGLGAEACRNLYFKWVLGLDNGTDNHRCPEPGGNCHLLGSIYHSTPAIVNRPSEMLRDETYERFADDLALRPLVLYTSTTDGFLHAFKVAPNDPDDSFKVDGPAPANNELWSFIPPAMLALLPQQYPDNPTRLLDGAPIVREVVATPVAGGYAFERSAEGARSNQSTWRTVLVQGMGQDPGYFALDVTDPVAGPVFLWQVTTDVDGRPLFGESSGTPLITTLFFADGAAEEREIAVAILPGGDGPRGTESCPRIDPDPEGIPGEFVRSQVPCYTDAAAIRGRSLTIVRLDNGKIIRTFRRATSEVPTALGTRVNVAPLDSPITGQPVAFPGETGAVADRVFVGDRDGTLWRLDLSSTAPQNWTVNLFFDAYWNHTSNEGQPIDTPPVLSVDALGRVTVAFSTGDQDVLTSQQQTNYVVSLTELASPAAGADETVSVNWFERFTNGNRVAGPMTLFSGVLYFSTYQPVLTGSTDVCDTGLSCVFGLDYIEPATPDTPDSGGRQALPTELTTGLPQSQKCVAGSSDPNNPIPEGSVVFGVAVTQLPSCVEEPSTESVDRYYGSGTHKRVTRISPARFQLLMQTGSAGATVEGGQTKVVSVELPAPNTSPRIDSWAAILD